MVPLASSNFQEVQRALQLSRQFSAPAIQRLDLTNFFFFFCCELPPSLHSLVNATMVSIDAEKGKKGKNFSGEEERILCRSFLHILQDLIAGNGRRNVAL